MSDKLISSVFGILLAAIALLGSGCAAPSDHRDQPMAATVTIEDQWVSSAKMGMAAMFGTFTNNGHHEARIVSGDSPVAARIEVHEVVPDAAGNTSMRPKPGGITVPAGGTHELTPGGDHLMLMDVAEALQPGAEVALTVVFEDGSTLPVTAQVREFAGGNEEYEPGNTTATPHHDHG